MIEARASNNMKLLQNPYSCGICKESFSSAKTLLNHVQMNHAHVKISKENKDAKDQDKIRLVKCKKENLKDETDQNETIPNHFVTETFRSNLSEPMEDEDVEATKIENSSEGKKYPENYTIFCDPTLPFGPQTNYNVQEITMNEKFTESFSETKTDTKVMETNSLKICPSET